MRYVILGAGAIGGTIAGRLFDAGHDVAVIARGPHLEQLRQKGLRLVRPDADQTLPIPAYASPAGAELTVDDVLVLATKVQHAEAAIESVAEVAPSSLSIVCAQNGVASERFALRRFANVYAMCVMLPADHLEPGVVHAYGAPSSGVLDLGGYPHGVDDRARRIAADFDASGLSSRAINDPMRVKYGKLLRNLRNAVDALAGAGAKLSEVTLRAQEEGRRVLEVAGIEAATPEEDADRRRGHVERRPIGDRAKSGSSTWQSLARGTGSVETDYLNGEIVLLGRLHGVPTPVNAAIQHAARSAAAGGRAPGSMSLEELQTSVRASLHAGT